MMAVCSGELPSDSYLWAPPPQERARPQVLEQCPSRWARRRHLEPGALGTSSMTPHSVPTGHCRPETKVCRCCKWPWTEAGPAFPSCCGGPGVGCSHGHTHSFHPGGGRPQGLGQGTAPLRLRTSLRTQTPLHRQAPGLAAARLCLLLRRPGPSAQQQSLQDSLCPHSQMAKSPWPSSWEQFFPGSGLPGDSG